MTDGEFTTILVLLLVVMVLGYVAGYKAAKNGDSEPWGPHE